MKPMRYFFLCLCALAIGRFDSVTAQNPDRFSYQELSERFHKLDTSLNAESVRDLYYMSATLPSYSPEQLITIEANIRQASADGNYSYAIELSDSLLSFYPVSLTALFEKAYSCARLGRNAEEHIASMQYKVLLRSLTRSYDGVSFSTAIPVINQNDEFEIIRFLNYTASGFREQSYNGKTYDVWSLKKNKKKITELYFDTSVPVKLIRMKQVELLREK